MLQNMKPVVCYAMPDLLSEGSCDLIPPNE